MSKAVLTAIRASPADTTLTLAQFARLGIHHDLNPKVAIVGSLGWEDWSALENQYVSVGETGDATLPRNWEDTERYGLGFHYTVAETWKVRFGVNYTISSY